MFLMLRCGFFVQKDTLDIVISAASEEIVTLATLQKHRTSKKI